MTNLFDLQILVDRFTTNIEFYKDTRNALHLMEYDKTSQQNKDGNYHEFIPNFLIIFYKEFGDLMKGSD